MSAWAMARTEQLAATEAALWASRGLSPTEHFVTLRSGPTVRVQEVGEGPPVIFVHGATNGGTSWFSLMGDLPGFRCIAIDRPGCGLSSPLQGVNGLADYQSYADDLIVEVMDAMELPSAAAVVTSLGGFFGVRGAAAHSDRFTHVVFMSWLMGAPMASVPMSLRFAALPGLGKLTAKVPPTRGMVKMLLKQIGLDRAVRTGTFSDEMIDWFCALLKETDTIRNEVETAPELIRPIAGLNSELLHTEELLAKITAPTLFLWGDEDPNGTQVEAEEFTAMLPGSTLEMITEAGHAPWIDEPELVASRTLAFLMNGAPS